MPYKRKDQPVRSWIARWIYLDQRQSRELAYAFVKLVPQSMPVRPFQNVAQYGSGYRGGG